MGKDGPSARSTLKVVCSRQETIRDELAREIIIIITISIAVSITTRTINTTQCLQYGDTVGFEIIMVRYLRSAYPYCVTHSRRGFSSDNDVDGGR